MPAVVVQGQHVREDAPVGVVVEVVGPDEQGHFVAHLGQQQHAAEHGPLGFEAPRRLAVEQLADAVAASQSAAVVFNRGHGCRSVVGKSALSGDGHNATSDAVDPTNR